MLRSFTLTVASSAVLLLCAASAGAHAPTAAFTYAPQAPRTGEPISLAASGSVEEKNGPLRFTWDLDADGAFDDADGSTATANLRRGTRAVRVRATDRNGESSTASRIIEVGNAAPAGAAIAFGPAAPRTGDAVTFAASAVDPEGDALTYRWDLDGDGTYEAEGDHAARSFVRGERTVRLQVRDAFGAAAEVTRTITVGNAAPGGDFSWAPGALSNAAVRLTVAGVDDPDDGADAVTAAWDLDDDGSFEAEGATADASFASPGRHTVALRLTDPHGAATIVRRSVDIANRPPVAAIEAGPAVAMAGDEIVFTGHASDPDNGTLQLTLAWDLDGDGAFDDGDATTATRAFEAGPHVVRLRVTDASGDSFVAERTLTVADPAGGGAPSALSPLSATSALLRPALIRPFPVVRLRGRLTRGGVLVELLRVSGVPAAARVAATCRGTGCRGLARALARRGLKAVAHRRLGAGAVLEVRITQPGRLGKLTRFTFRRNRAPLRYDGCISPGGAPRSCA